MKSLAFLRSIAVRCALFAGALLVTAVLSFRPIQTTFAANLRVEWLELQTQAGNPVWSVPASLKIIGACPSLRPSSLRLAEGVGVTMRRRGLGPLHLEVRAAKGGSGVLVDARGNECLLPAQAVFRVEDPERAWKEDPIRFPVRASIRLPRLSHFNSGEAIPMLLSGTIQMIGRSIDGRSLFESGKTELAPGDTVLMSDPATVAVGVVALTDAPGLDLTCRFVADGLIIARFASEGYVLSTPLTARIVNDKPLQLAWTGLGVVAGWLLKCLFPSKKEKI